MVNCGTSFYIGCMQPFIPLLLNCNSGSILANEKIFGPWLAEHPKTNLSPWGMTAVLVPNTPLYQMYPCTQLRHHHRATALLRNMCQTKTETSTEKQLTVQIWACSISLDNAHHGNIKEKHIKFTFKLKSHQVALNVIKVPRGSEAAMNHSAIKTMEMH